MVACGESPAGDTTTSVDTSSTGAGSGSTAASQSSTTAPGDSGTTAVDSTGGVGSSSSDGGSTGGAATDPGCIECVVLADGLTGGRGIAVDGTHVYFTDQSAGTLARAPKGGGDIELLASGLDAPYDVAVADGWVYWTEFVDAGAVARMPVAGGATEVFDDDDERPRAIAVDGSHVYWTTFGSGIGGVWRASLAGGTAEKLLGAYAGIADIVLDGTRFYVTSHDPEPGGGGVTFIEPPPPADSPGALVSVPLAGDADGTQQQILATDLAQPWNLAMVGGSFVWAQGDGPSANNPNTIMALAAAGGEASPVASDQAAPWGVAADADAVYWTDVTEVKSAPHRGGAPTVLATQQNEARSIAVDDAGVYWITKTRVLQLPKS